VPRGGRRARAAEAEHRREPRRGDRVRHSQHPHRHVLQGRREDGHRHRRGAQVHAGADAGEVHGLRRPSSSSLRPPAFFVRLPERARYGLRCQCGRGAVARPGLRRCARRERGRRSRKAGRAGADSGEASSPAACMSTETAFAACGAAQAAPERGGVRPRLRCRTPPAAAALFRARARAGPCAGAECNRLRHQESLLMSSFCPPCVQGGCRVLQ